MEYPGEIVDYGYDGVGNRLSETKTTKATGTVLSAKTLAYNALNQLTAITDNANPQNDATLTYDDNGNLVTKTTATGTTEYVYDGQNRLIGVSAGGNTVANYAYDAEGLRIGKESLASTVGYVRDGLDVLTEYDATDTAIASYQYADGLLSLKSGTEGTAWYHDDTLGSPVVLTSSTGIQEASYKYEAFGLLKEKTGLSYNSHLFTEKELDQETGLYYFGARYYDPELGRFITQDAYLGDPQTPGSLHRYLYAYANPTVWTDPTGNYSESGHYYTVYFVALAAGMEDDVARTVATFAQLPDEIKELDAFSTQFGAVVHGFGKNGGVFTSRRNEVHPADHALEGGSALEATARGKTLMGLTSKEAELLGFASHFFGDTFAHRTMQSWQSEAPRLSKTGWGHAGQGDAPDEIWRRPALYREYAMTLYREYRNLGFLSKQNARLSEEAVQQRLDLFLASLEEKGEEEYWGARPEYALSAAEKGDDRGFIEIMNEEEVNNARGMLVDLKRDAGIAGGTDWRPERHRAQAARKFPYGDIGMETFDLLLTPDEKEKRLFTNQRDYIQLYNRVSNQAINGVVRETP